jgi:hypothetical protein
MKGILVRTPLRYEATKNWVEDRGWRGVGNYGHSWDLREYPSTK